MSEDKAVDIVARYVGPEVTSEHIHAVQAIEEAFTLYSLCVEIRVSQECHQATRICTESLCHYIGA